LLALDLGFKDNYPFHWHTLHSQSKTTEKGRSKKKNGKNFTFSVEDSSLYRGVHSVDQSLALWFQFPQKLSFYKKEIICLGLLYPFHKEVGFYQRVVYLPLAAENSVRIFFCSYLV